MLLQSDNNKVQINLCHQEVIIRYFLVYNAEKKQTTLTTTTALLVITPEGDLYVFHILAGDSLEKQLKKPVSHLTTMTTSL